MNPTNNQPAKTDQPKNTHANQFGPNSFWTIRLHSGQEFGPLRLSEIALLVKQKALAEDAQACAERESKWHSLTKVLSNAFDKSSITVIDPMGSPQVAELTPKDANLLPNQAATNPNKPDNNFSIFVEDAFSEEKNKARGNGVLIAMLFMYTAVFILLIFGAYKVGPIAFAMSQRGSLPESQTHHDSFESWWAEYLGQRGSLSPSQKRNNTIMLLCVWVIWLSVVIYPLFGALGCGYQLHSRLMKRLS